MQPRVNQQRFFMFSYFTFTRTLLIQIIALLLIFLASAQAFVANHPGLSLMQKQFLTSMALSTKSVFIDIQAQRNKIKMLQTEYKQKKSLAIDEIKWLQQVAQDYKYQPFNYQLDNDWKELLQRVDIVPYSLVLAQAANESNWGRSRFAQQGNAYFGQRCAVPGCGLKALKAYFITKSFISKKDSIAAYVLNLNTHEAYTEFRQVRAFMRNKYQELDSLMLMKELIAYSERGRAYIRDISNLIKSLRLQKNFDKIKS